MRSEDTTSCKNIASGFRHAVPTNPLMEDTMSHPFAAHRQHHVEHERVKHIAKGYASGGSVSAQVPSDGLTDDQKAMQNAMGQGKRSGGKVSGGKTKHRADRVHRARGGKVHGKHAKTVVNVITGGHGAPGGAPMGGPPMMPPPAPAMAMPPRPPIAPAPGAAVVPPPGVGAGPPPPGMIRHAGGRAYADGGAVKPGPAWKEGLRSGTQVQHDDGKNDGKDIGRPKPITYRKGGAVEASKKMGPDMDGGAGGGVGRLEKAKRAARDYARA